MTPSLGICTYKQSQWKIHILEKLIEIVAQWAAHDIFLSTNSANGRISQQIMSCRDRYFTRTEAMRCRFGEMASVSRTNTTNKQIKPPTCIGCLRILVSSAYVIHILQFADSQTEKERSWSYKRKTRNRLPVATFKGKSREKKNFSGRWIFMRAARSPQISRNETC